jgi:predicted RNase H-like nuclease
MMVVAQRLASGLARPYPPDFARDAHGLPIAIHA